MGVKEAARCAKAYIADLFADEGISNIMLEEVDFEDLPAKWKITVGFYRRGDVDTNSLAGAIGVLMPPRQRSFKVVCIRDRDGQVLSVKHRSVPGGE
jgi:hypothetical protein